RQLVDNVGAWFTEHPLYDPKGQPIMVPDFGFPGRGRVQGQLTRAKATLDKAEKVLHALPLRGRQADWGATSDEKRDEVDRALGYVELYGKYAECEAVYGVERLLALHGSLEGDDQRDFGCDPRVVDWDRFIAEVHLPSIVQHARVRTTPGGRQGE